MHSLRQGRHVAPFTLCLALLGCASFALASSSRTASSRMTESQQVAAEQAFQQSVEAQRSLIDKENTATPRAAWAGDYYFGDGLGANVTLSLAPHAGVAATWLGCLGMYEANKGTVIPQADGSLLLKYERPNHESGIGFAEHVVPVPWGDRMYLLSAKQLAAFAGAVNMGDEPRKDAHGLFLMREGDEKRRVSGLPGLPPAQQRLIHQVPLEVGVVSAKLLHDSRPDHFECRYRLTLDHGAKAGLAAGMELQTGGLCAGNRITLEHTTPNQAVGTMSLYGQDCTDQAKQPSTKTRLTTGAYRRASPKDKP